METSLLVVDSNAISWMLLAFCCTDLSSQRSGGKYDELAIGEDEAHSRASVIPGLSCGDTREARRGRGTGCP